MAIVSNIQENRGLVRISLDGMEWLKLCKKHFNLLPLHVGDAVDPEKYIDRMAALQAADCYEAALTMLDQAAQTSGNLRAKLMRRGFVSPAADASVDRLMENGLVDDTRYAQRVAQAQLGKAVGAYAVRRKLQSRRLPEDAIDAVMEDFDSEQQAQACRQAAEKLWRKYAGLPPREGRAKLSQALARRGFGWEAIHSAVEALSSENEPDDWY